MVLSASFLKGRLHSIIDAQLQAATVHFTRYSQPWSGWSSTEQNSLMATGTNRKSNCLLVESPPHLSKFISLSLSINGYP